MQFIQKTSRTTRGRKALRSVLSASAATLLLAGWTSAAKAEVISFPSSAQFIPSSAFTTPPPATVFGDFPTATITYTNSGTSYSPINFYSFNATAGQTIRLDIDNAANGGTSTGSNNAPFGGSNDLSLALYSGKGALLAYNFDSPVDPGSILTTDSRFGTASRDPFIGDYTLTYPDTNFMGTPINSPADPNRNTYYVAVMAGGRFGTTPAFSASAQNATLSALTRPDGLDGGTAVNYSSLGYDVRSNGATGTPQFNIGRVGVSSYTLQVSLSPAATAPVPEPGTMALMGLGLAGLAASRRRKKSKAEAAAIVA